MLMPSCTLPLLRCACRLKQLRTSWQQNPDNAPVVARLSEQCRDLLDKMFDTNQVRACAATPLVFCMTCNATKWQVCCMIW